MFGKKQDKKNESEESSSLSQREIILKQISKYFVRYYEAVVAVVVLLIFVIGFIFIINPKYKKINEMENYTLIDLDTGKAKIETYLGKLEEYRDSYKNITDVSKERIDKAIPQDSHVEMLYAQIESLTKKQGVAIRSLSIVNNETITDPKVKKEASPDSKLKLGQADISLVVSGIDYSGLKRLLVAFENNLRLMDVFSVSFKPEQKEAELVIFSYYLN